MSGPGGKPSAPARSTSIVGRADGTGGVEGASSISPLSRLGALENLGARLSQPAYLRRYVVAAVVCALLLAVARLPLVRQSLTRAVTLSAPVAVHHASIQGRTIVLGPANDVHAEAGWQAAIRPGHEYRIEFDVDNPEPLLPVTLYGDLYGPGYDNPEQDFVQVVPPGVTGYRIVRTIPSGAAPQQVSLRVFHFDRATIRVRSAQVTEPRLLVRVLVRAAKLALLLALIGGASCALRADVGFGRRSLLAMVSAASWPLAIGLVALVGVLTASLMGPPVILADEYAYRATTAAVATGVDGGLADTTYETLPNRLYFAVYALSSFAPDPFAAARVINVLFLIATLVAFWWLSRQMGIAVLGAALGLAYGLGAFATYTAYFMPETMFAAVYVAAFATASVALAELATGFALISGVAFAALAFVKPHAWAALAALVAFGIVFAWRSGAPRLSVARVAVAFTVAFAIAWAALRTLLPRPDTSALGLYSGIGHLVLTALYDSSKWPLILQFVLVHLLVVGSLAAPALYCGLRSVFQPLQPACRTREERLAHVTAGLASLGLLALIAMTSAFSAAIVGTNPAESAERLHMRYYSFAIPLVILAFLASSVGQQSVRQAYVMSSIWIICCVGAFVYLPKYHPTMWDAPDLLVGGGIARYGVVPFGALGIVVAIWLRRRAPAMALGVLAAYFTASMIAGAVVRDMQARWPDMPEDRAGRFVASLARESRLPVLIVANLQQGDAWPYRVAAYAPTWTRFMSSDKLSDLIRGGMPRGTMVIVNGEQPLPGLSPLARFGTLRVARWEGT
jgi:phosphoglycerol transferase